MLFHNSSSDQKVEILISNRTILRILFMVVCLILSLRLLGLASHALVLVFMSFFLALALNAPVHWIGQRLPGKRKGSRALATAVSYLIVVLALSAFLAILVPPTARQVSSFVSSAPKIVSDLQDQNSSVGSFIRDHNLENFINDASSELTSIAKNSGSTAITTVTNVGSSLFSVLIVLAMTFMMLTEGPKWLKQVKKLLPADKRDHIVYLADEMYGVVRGFVNGQVLLALLASFMILPVLLIMDVPYAGALAVIVFVCGLIPMIGHFIGATIVTIIALFTSPVSAIVVLSYYILYQQIENYVIQPRVQSNTTNISPLLVFVAVTVGVSINGLIGGLVAIPVMGCIRIFVLDYLERQNKLPS